MSDIILKKIHKAILDGGGGGGSDVGDKGIIGEAILLIGTNPSVDETVGMGAEVYIFKAAASSAYEVTIGADANASRANLVSKVNSVTAISLRASIATGGFKIQNADGPGGDPVAGTANIALSETLGAAADIWNQNNLNTTGRPDYLYQSSDNIEITAQNIATIFTVPLAFTPLDFTYRFVNTDGWPKPSCTSKAEIFGNGIKVTVSNGGSPAVPTDVICFTAKGNVLI